LNQQITAVPLDCASRQVNRGRADSGCDLIEGQLITLEALFGYLNRYFVRARRLEFDNRYPGLAHKLVTQRLAELFHLTLTEVPENLNATHLVPVGDFSDGWPLRIGRETSNRIDTGVDIVG